jgi:hypothetical protein
MDDISRSTELLWQELKFMVTVLRSPAARFEDLFARIMRAAHPDSFHIPRAAGPSGDKRCDGWDSTTKTLYAVYAPFSAIRKSAVRKKISNDFHGARERWPEMRRWRFVHNDFFGLAAEITRELEALRASPDSLGIEILSDWGPEELWRVVSSLPEADRRRILGAPERPEIQTHSTFDATVLRYHDNVHPASARAAVRSLAQLCENFQSDSIVNPLISCAFAGTLISWWMNDEHLQREYTKILYQQSDAIPFETELNTLTFAIRCVEICAQRMNMPVKIFLASQLDESSLLDDSQKVILSLVDDVLGNRDPGFSVDDPSVRRGFVTACFNTIIDLVGLISAGGIPAVFTLQDLFVSLQRLDHSGGSIVV